MATNRNFMEHAMANAGVTDHAGEQQVVCANEACGTTFWMKTNEIVLASKVNQAILCQECKQQAIAAVLGLFLEGPE